MFIFFTTNWYFWVQRVHDYGLGFATYNISQISTVTLCYNFVKAFTIVSRQLDIAIQGSVVCTCDGSINIWVYSVKKTFWTKIQYTIKNKIMKQFFFNSPYFIDKWVISEQFAYNLRFKYLARWICKPSWIVMKLGQSLLFKVKKVLKWYLFIYFFVTWNMIYAIISFNFAHENNVLIHLNYKFFCSGITEVNVK